MLCRSRTLSRLTATFAATALCTGLITLAPRVSEASQLEGETTFLGVEGEGDEAGALSDALRWDLGQRGKDDGNTMSLAELKLTMGCGDSELECFASGGETLGSSELVYGSMAKLGDTWKINLRVLEVESGELSGEVNRDLSPEDLSEGSVAATAASLIDELYGLTPIPEPEEVDPDEGVEEAIEEGIEEGPDEAGEGELIWGAYSGRPTWKWVGVGLSGGLAVAAIGTAIGSTIAIGPKGPIRQELIQAAEDSVGQPNEVSTDSADLCAEARSNPDPVDPTAVKNAEMTRICNKADSMATVATASWIATGVFAATTVLFTTLLFVHRNKAGAQAVRRHKLQLGAAPLREGGFMAGGSFHF